MVGELIKYRFLIKHIEELISQSPSFLLLYFSNKQIIPKNSLIMLEKNPIQKREW